MTPANSGPRRVPATCRALLVTLFCLAPWLSAVAADEDPWARADALATELAAAPAAPAADDEDGALEAYGQRQRRLRELGLAIDAALAASSDGDAARERAGPLVRTLFDAQRKTVRGLRGHLDTVRGERAGADPLAILAYEYTLRDYDTLLNSLLSDYHDNAERAKRVGLDAAAAVEHLEQVLRDRADGLAERLETTRERLRTTRGRAETATGDQQSALQSEATALEERMDRLKNGLRASTELLRARGQDVSEYAQVLIRTTGEISGDILDTRVLRGLLDEWLDVVARRIARDGPGWLFKALLFVAILLVFKLLAKLAERVVRKAVSTSRMHFSALLQDFFVTVAANAVLLFGLLIALSQIGLELGPVLAGLGVAGFIVGFALQDTLSNFASGMMILIYRPFDVGDVVEAGGVNGKVSEMSLVSTTILTFDNQKLVVPNNKIWGDVIRNVNARPERRVDMTFGIGYDDDVEHAERILREIVTGHELVLEDPEPTIRLHTLGESSVDFIVRPWVKAADYWTVHWDVTRAVKRRFDAEGISIPYPQRDLHVHHVPGDGDAPEARSG